MDATCHLFFPKQEEEQGWVAAGRQAVAVRWKALSHEPHLRGNWAAWTSAWARQLSVSKFSRKLNSPNAKAEVHSWACSRCDRKELMLRLTLVTYLLPFWHLMKRVFSSQERTCKSLTKILKPMKIFQLSGSRILKKTDEEWISNRQDKLWVGKKGGRKGKNRGKPLSLKTRCSC